MNAAKHATWACAALIALALFCWYAARAEPLPPRLDTQTLQTTPDQRVTHLHVQQFDATGRLVRQLTTPFMHHIPAEDTHWLKTPLIVVTEFNKPPLDIRSQEATSRAGGQRITFQHDVLIHHGAYEHNQAGTITTDELSYLPREQLATTQADITWIQAGNALQSTGMNAYLAEHRVELLHHPRATYEPHHG